MIENKDNCSQLFRYLWGYFAKCFLLVYYSCYSLDTTHVEYTLLKRKKNHVIRISNTYDKLIKRIKQNKNKHRRKYFYTCYEHVIIQIEINA